VRKITTQRTTRRITRKEDYENYDKENQEVDNNEQVDGNKGNDDEKS